MEKSLVLKSLRVYHPFMYIYDPGGFVALLGSKNIVLLLPAENSNPICFFRLA